MPALQEGDERGSASPDDAHFYFVQGFQVAQDVCPFHGVPTLLGPLIKLLHRQQGEKTLACCPMPSTLTAMRANIRAPNMSSSDPLELLAVGERTEVSSHSLQHLNI